MDSMWNFIGGFWWLVFPLAGVVGGAWRGIDKASKDRHQRRMERMRLQHALRNGTDPTSGPTTAPIELDAAQRQDQRLAARAAEHAAALERVLSEHDAVNARWLDYELDVSKLIEFPLMTDVREPLMVAYLKAKRRADSMRPSEPVDPGMVSEESLERFREAVNEYRVAFDIAEAEARRVKDRDFGDDERQRLALARRLITLSVDQAATLAERQTAYHRARKALEGLLSRSADTVRSMEEAAQRAITAAPGRPSVPPAA